MTKQFKCFKQLEVLISFQENKTDSVQTEMVNEAGIEGKDSKDNSKHPESDTCSVSLENEPVIDADIIPQGPDSSPQSPTHEWYNSQGVRFTPQQEGI